MTAVPLSEPVRVELDIPALRRGSADALSACYYAHAGRLLMVLERFTSSRADAEDVVHDVFVMLPDLLQRYDERGQFSGWLTRVAVRAALMRGRRERRLLPLEAAPRTAAVTYERDIVALHAAHDAVAALPEALRHVVVLRVMLDLPHAEIATMLGISVGTSEVRLHRAIKRLRESVRRDA
jgi:RNA polymerase sigma-70 factor (ECF subfamily)